jgi:hypothetical protein
MNTCYTTLLSGSVARQEKIMHAHESPFYHYTQCPHSFTITYRGKKYSRILFGQTSYINDLLVTFILQSKPVSFADDDTSIIISRPEMDYLQNCMNDVFSSFNKWFKANKLALNFDRTGGMKLCNNSKTCININIGYDKTIEDLETTEFRGLRIDSNLNWKNYP